MRLTAQGVVLISAQTLGGALAGGVLRGIWGEERAVSFVDRPHLSSLGWR
jgi:hypothetical protein